MEENQGIMSLAPQVAPPPQMGANMQRTPLEDPEVAQAYEQLRSSVGPKEFTDEVLNASGQSDPQLVEQFKQALSQQQLPAELIAALQDMLQLIFESPQDYAEIRKELLAEGVPEDLLPETFDIEFFIALKMALEQVQGTVPQQPMGLAEGGIVSLHPLARELQKFGREGDTMLAHINPIEAEMLRRMGGSGTTNPYTGLPEYFFKKLGRAIAAPFKAVGKAVTGAAKVVGKALKSVVGAVKKFAKSTVGRIIITVAAAYFLGPAAASFLKVSSVAGVAAVSGFVGSFSSGMAAGDGLKSSLKAGAVGAVTAGTLAVATGGTAALQSGSYAGPTTISGQYDKLKESLANFGTPKLADQTAALDPGVSPNANPPSNITSTPIDSSFSPVPDVNPSGFSYSPSGELIPSVPTNIGPGNLSAQPFTPSGDYLSSLDAQNILNTGGSVPTQNVIPAMQPASYSLTGAAPVTEGFQGTVVRPDAFSPSATNYLTGEAGSLSGGTGINSGVARAPGVDVLGRAASPATAATAASTAQPGVLDLLGQGEYTQAAKAAGQNVLDFYNPQPSQVALDKAYQQELANRARLGLDFSSTAAKEAALASATKSAAPLVGTYGRLAATGLGAAYLGGAFDPQPPPEVPEGFSGPTGTELLAQDPAQYGVTPGGGTSEYFASYPGMAPTNLGYGTTNFTYAPSGYAQSQAPQGQGIQTLRPPMLRDLDLRGFNPMGIAGLAPRRYNVGGFVPGYQKGGSPQRMSDYPRRNGPINGPGTGTSDSIPAMLSDGEFVFTANAVRGAGNGSRREGARKMYAMMKALERKS